MIKKRGNPFRFAKKMVGNPFRYAKSLSILVAQIKISKLIFIIRSLVWSGLGDLNS